MDFWTFFNVVIPTIIVVMAYIAYRLHEWDLDRKHKHRQPGE